MGKILDVGTNTEKLLRKKQRELFILHELDKLSDNAADIDIFLNAILREMMKVMNVELGVLLLHYEASNTLEVGAAIDRGIFKSDDYSLLKSIAKDTISKGRIMVINETSRHKGLKKFRIRNILSSPIRYGSKMTGVLILINKRNQGFSKDDLHIFSMMLSHVDSTIEHSKVYKQLDSKKRELDVLYTVDRLRDTIKDFDTLMKAVLDEMKDIIDSRISFIALYDKDKQLVDLKVPSNIRSSNFLKLNKSIIDDACKKAMEKGEIVSEKNLNDDVKNIIVVPAVLENAMAVFGALNSNRNEGFSFEEKTLLKAVATQLDSAIFEDLEKKQIKTVFKRYVSPDVMETILKSDEDYLKTDKRDVSILFSDLRGFTSLSETMDAEEVADMLNDYFTAMTKVIMDLRGTVDKFLGDGIMAIFGAPVYYEGHALRAVKAASAMQKEFKKIQKKWKSEGKPVVELGVGVNTGSVVVGNIGSLDRTDYTAIGDCVNTSSRLCGKAAGGQILISSSTQSEVKKTVKTTKLEPMSLKGKRDKIDVYEVVSVK